MTAASEQELYDALDALRMAAVRCLMRADDKRRDTLVLAVERADQALAAARVARSGEHAAVRSEREGDEG